MKGNLTRSELREERRLKQINSKHKSHKEVVKNSILGPFMWLVRLYLSVFIIPLSVVFIANRVAFVLNLPSLTQITTDTMGCIMLLAVITTKVVALISLPLVFLEALLQSAENDED